MSNPIERQITINRTDQGHGPVSACVVTDAAGLMPIRLESNGYEIWLRWSEWDEIRDHIEYCSPMARGEGAIDPDSVQTNTPGVEARWYPYAACKAMPGLVPYDYEPLECVLERGHGEDGVDHCDRLGRRWQS
jgi:hypothetical protein